MSNGKVTKVESYDKLIELMAKDNTVVVFSAVDWCIPCQRLAPHVAAAADTLSDYNFLDVDIDHVEGVKEEFGIMSVPQVWFYESNRDGLGGRSIKARTALQLVSEIRR